MSTISRFYQRAKIWVILFFKNDKIPGLGTIVDELAKFAKETLGMFVAGAVDCSKEEEICDEFSIHDQVKLILYPEDNSTISFTIPINSKAEDIKNKAVKIMKSNVINVNGNLYAEFMKKESSKIHILLFSDKQWPTPMYKYFSNKYKNSFVFGFVNISEGSLFKKYMIMKTPSIILINDLNNPKGLKYEGDIRIGPIDRFLKSFSNKQMINRIEGPVRLTKELLAQGKCKLDDPNWCVILLLDKMSKEKELKIKNLMKGYIYDNIAFYYYITDTDLSFLDSFKPLLTQKLKQYQNSIIVIRSLKKKFTIIEDFEGKTMKELKLSIDTILSGSGQFQKINDQYFHL